MEIHRSLDPDKTLNYIVAHLFVGICVDMGLLYLAIPTLGIREALTKKKNVFFWALPEKGGGDPCPNFLTLFFHHVVPYILTSISCYVILFGHF